jgi:signal transduction histidine kinase
MSSVPIPERQFDEGAETAAREPELVAAPAIKILLVDDDPKNLTVLETVLDHPGYRLVRASSGDEALLALIDQEFALLILDIQMPGMTGFELAQIIKQRKKTAHVPIIFLTAYYNEDAHVLEGYDTGAVDYLYKPVNPVVLRSKVSVFADLYRKNREVAAANSVLRDEVERRRRIEEQLRELNQTLEDRVEERTRELREHTARLRRANEGLEEFAYAASHDLHEPLRNIALCTELLDKRYRAHLNEEAARFLETISEGAHRMMQLISGLLEYAHADYVDDPIPQSDAEAALAQVLKNLDPCVQESRATITHDRLPSIPIQTIHLEQLLQNLIGNALKYKKDGRPPRVHVSAIQAEAQWRFSIADNGIGIEPEYHERVFGLFKRLHSARGEYAGVGMGLAICRRIVERYGGRIWLHSEVGQGATFYFTIPITKRSRPEKNS